MDIRITIGNKHLLFLITFSSLILVLSIATAYSPGASGGVPAAMGHSVDEMDWGNPIPTGIVVSGDIQSQGGDVCIIGGNCLSTAGGGSSLWSTSGSNIYYDTGNVGIGTSNPGSQRLAVDGSVSISSGGLALGTGVFTNQPMITLGESSVVQRQGGTSGILRYDDPFSGAYTLFVSGMTDVMTLHDNGNVGIGIDDPGGYRLWVDGDLRVFGNVDFGTSSFKYNSSSDTLTVGNIAPGNYCDQNGQNCRTFSSVGDINSVSGGSGLTPDSCTSGSCTLNVDTGSAATTGLEIVSDEVSLMNNGCVAGEVLKRNSANSGWECVADSTGSVAGTIGAVMYLEGEPVPANCPSGWTQAYYGDYYVGTITSRQTRQRVCYRTDRMCLVMYFLSNLATVPNCPSGWTSADVQTVEGAGTTTAGLRNQRRTCYRC